MLPRCHTCFPAHRLCSWSDPPWSMSLVCNPAERYLTSKFSYFHFSNPTHKTKTGTANRWETANSKSPGAIIMISQWERKQGPAVRSYLLYSSLASVRLYCAFHQPQQTVQKWWGKTILLSQTGIVDFPSSNFNLEGEILSTSGVAQTKDFKIMFLEFRWVGIGGRLSDFVITSGSVNEFPNQRIPCFCKQLNAK